MPERLPPLASHEQAVKDCLEIDFPRSLDLRNKDEVVDLLKNALGVLSAKIPKVDEVVILLVGSVARDQTRKNIKAKICSTNNSDVDIIPIYPPLFGYNNKLRFETALSFIFEGYGVEVDGYQNSILSVEYFDTMVRWSWPKEMIDTNTVVLSTNRIMAQKTEEIVRRDYKNVITQHGWSRNHNFDPDMPPKKFKRVGMN